MCKGFNKTQFYKFNKFYFFNLSEKFVEKQKPFAFFKIYIIYFVYVKDLWVSM